MADPRPGYWAKASRCTPVRRCQYLPDRVRQRLTKLCARRQQQGSVRYWQLKPDCQWDEMIEL